MRRQLIHRDDVPQIKPRSNGHDAGFVSDEKLTERRRKILGPNGGNIGPGSHKRDEYVEDIARQAGEVFSQDIYDWLYERVESYQPKTTTNPAYNPTIHPRMVFQLRLLGAGMPLIANALNVTEDTIKAWIEKYPHFGVAYHRGAELADARVAESLYHRAVGYSHAAVKHFCTNGIVTEVRYTRHFPPDPHCGTFWLTNRRRDAWKNRQATELSGANGEPLIPPQLVINPVKPNGAA